MFWYSFIILFLLQAKSALFVLIYWIFCEKIQLCLSLSFIVDLAPSNREQAIIKELNHKDNESPCAAPWRCDTGAFRFACRLFADFFNGFFCVFMVVHGDSRELQKWKNRMDTWFFKHPCGVLSSCASRSRTCDGGVKVLCLTAWRWRIIKCGNSM